MSISRIVTDADKRVACMMAYRKNDELDNPLCLVAGEWRRGCDGCVWSTDSIPLI